MCIGQKSYFFARCHLGTKIQKSRCPAENLGAGFVQVLEVLEIDDVEKKSWKVLEIGDKVLESPGN